MRISDIAMTSFVVALIIACLFGPYVISIILTIVLLGANLGGRRETGA